LLHKQRHQLIVFPGLFISHHLYLSSYFSRQDSQCSWM
jgi:hypothetical protein